MRRVAKLLSGSVALCLAVIACSDYGSVTDVRPPRQIAEDSLYPAITLHAPAGVLEAGDSLVATVTDDSRVSVAVAFLLDQDRRILWRSDTVRVESDSADVNFPLTGLPPTFPFGEEVFYTAWARDASGKARFAGGTVTTVEEVVENPAADTTRYKWDESVDRCRDTATGQFAKTELCDVTRIETKEIEEPAQTLEKADVKTAIVAFGRTFSLGEGIAFGGMAYDALERMIYLTVPDRNEVRGLSLSDMKLANWRIPVGSRPGLVAFQRYAWGVKPVLAIVNDGGLDVSLVDLSARGAGGSERWRVQIPLIRVSIDGRKQSIQARATSLLIHCPDDFCHDPVLYLGSPQVGDESQIAMRTLAIADIEPNANFSIFTPEYRPNVIPEDHAVVVEAWVVDPYTGAETRILEPVIASKCGTLAIGSTRVAAPERFGGDLFLIEDGEAQGACGGSGRVLRFSRDNFGPYYISTPPVINYDFDTSLANLQEVVANADGSLVLLRAGNQVFVTTGDLRRLGTIEVSGATSLAFLEQQTGGPGHGKNGALFAVGANDGVHIFEAAHFTEVKHYETARGFGRELMFLRPDNGDRLLVLGFTGNGDGLLVVETSLSELRNAIQH